ncbi:MAG: TM0106 family RecB-like putative nuclease [Deltaproteobacteria bacterium]|nr:TM0106 family RecB-like putative nuclease [Deltaproteobacteria bacterium]
MRRPTGLAGTLFSTAQKLFGSAAAHAKKRLIQKLERVVPKEILEVARDLHLLETEQRHPDTYDRRPHLGDTHTLIEDGAFDPPPQVVSTPDTVFTESAKPQFLYSPRDLVKFLKSPITTWLDHYRLTAHPGEKELPLDNEDQPDLRIWMDKGLEHEARFLKKIKSDFAEKNKTNDPHSQKRVAEIPEFETIKNQTERNNKRYEATLAAMREGADVVFQGYLKSNDGQFAGISDFLFKVPNAPGEVSAFGDYHYEVFDTKLAKKAKVEYLIQLCCYADYLEQMQGVRPRHIGVINGNSEWLLFETKDYYYYYENLRDRFLAFHASGEFTLENLPFIPKKRDYGRYDSYIREIIRERDLLAQVAGITNLQIINLNMAGIHTMTSLSGLVYQSQPNGGVRFYQRTIGSQELTPIKVSMASRTLINLIEQARLQLKSKGGLSQIPHAISADEHFALRTAGITNVKDLAATTLTLIRGIHPDRFLKLKKAAELVVRSQRLDQTQFEVIPPDPEFPESGLAALPPASLNDVILDLEGYPVDGPFEYLFGVMQKNPETGKNEFTGHWALNPTEEKEAFEKVMDWLYERWTNDPNMHVYHYASYEVTAFKRLAAKYATREKELDQMLKDGLFVDVYKIVKQGIRIGAESYSIKAVEKIYMPARTGEVQSALGSVVMFQNWLESPDGQSVQDSQKLKEIESYNREDDESLSLCIDWLRGVMQAHGISYYPRPIDTDQNQQEISEYRQKIETLKEGLLARAQQIAGKDAEAARVYELLSQLIEFHWRESKSVFWAKYARAEMTDDELVQDTGSLGVLTQMIESATQVFSQTKRKMAVEAFDRSAEHFISGPAASAALEKIPGEKVELEIDTGVAPFAPDDRSKSLVYTFKIKGGNVGSIITGQEYEFARETIKDEGASYKGQVDFVDQETGVVHIRFGPKALNAFDGSVPVTVSLHTENLSTMQYTYSFDPEQNTKLGVGDRCFLAHDLGIRCEITAIDYINGTVSIKFGPKALARMRGRPPINISLIPDEYVSPQTIQDAIVRILEKSFPDKASGKGRTRGKSLPKPLGNLLQKSRPALKGRATGPVIPEGMDETEGVYQAVKKMEGGTLAIQGPPGTGKSYQAAETIVRMIQDAKKSGRKIKIGITALSHASIVNLMEMIAARARAAGTQVNSVKVGDGDNSINSKELDPGISYKANTKAALAILDDVEIVGGTAWTFSNEEMTDQFDYLFVEEASQMSLANVLAISASTKNIVLLGDHKQLSQPNSGSHPGESGLSVFDYYLDGADTIPADKGILLKTTRRNRSDITAVYSEHVYNGHVVSHPDNDRQKVNLPEDANLIHHVPVEHGFVYVPVAHSENRHKSREEVEMVDEIVDELLERTFTDRDGKVRKFSKKDIMVISPYALQAQRLGLKLGDRATTGTVHKFQGRQAPVVILSMAASDINPSSPLMRFEFNEELLNVAFSRAQSLVIVVGSPRLEDIRVRQVNQMHDMNFYFRALKEARKTDRS